MFQEQAIDQDLLKGSILTSASLISEFVPPSEEQRKRGQFRQDIQDALTSVSMPGGLLGLPHQVVANRSVGARGNWTYFVYAKTKIPTLRFCEAAKFLDGNLALSASTFAQITIGPETLVGRVATHADILALEFRTELERKILEIEAMNEKAIHDKYPEQAAVILRNCKTL